MYQFLEVFCNDFGQPPTDQLLAYCDTFFNPTAENFLEGAFAKALSLEKCYLTICLRSGPWVRDRSIHCMRSFPVSGFNNTNVLKIALREERFVLTRWGGIVTSMAKPVLDGIFAHMDVIHTSRALEDQERSDPCAPGLLYRWSADEATANDKLLKGIRNFFSICCEDVHLSPALRPAAQP